MSVTYVNDGDLATPANVNEWLNRAAGETHNVLALGAIGDGVTDDTAAIQTAFANLTSGDSLLFPAGYTFLISENITKSSTNDLKIIARGATFSTTDNSLTVVFSFTSCDRLLWDGGHFIATETHTYFAANSPSEARSFIALTTCDYATIQNVSGTNKRRFITATTCPFLSVSGVKFDGFFQALSSGAQSDANNAPCINAIGCHYSTFADLQANNHGSVLLVSSSSTYGVVQGVRGRDLHDNGVYVSSGTNWTISNVAIRDVEGDVVQVRGSNITVTNVAANNANDAAVDMTGTGVSVDAFGANGYNLVCSNVVADGCEQAVNVGASDGEYPRDVVVSNIVANNCTATGESLAPVRISAVAGVSISNVSIRTVAADIGVLVAGPGSGTNCDGVSVVNARVEDINGSASSNRGGVRVQDATDVTVIGCEFADIASGNGVRILRCVDGIVALNHYDGGTVVRIPTGESNADFYVFGNRGNALVVDTASSAARDNVGFVTEANGTDTLANGTTSIVVTHGLSVTPDIQDISITPIEAWGSMTQFWISTPTSTQFTINADQDPGQDVDFAWTASVQ